MQEEEPDVLLFGSRGGSYVNLMMEMGIQLPATVMLNAYGSVERTRATVNGCEKLQWALPLNTPIALIYGEQDGWGFKTDDIKARAKTGSIGLTYCYISPTEGHTIKSLWSEDGLPEIIQAAYYRDFSEVEKKFPKQRRYKVVSPDGVSCQKSPQTNRTVICQQCHGPRRTSNAKAPTDACVYVPTGTPVVATQIQNGLVHSTEGYWVPVKLNNQTILEGPCWLNRCN